MLSMCGISAAAHPEVLARAEADGRVLVSADTDFGGLLALSGAPKPSVLLVRRLAGRRAAEQCAIILANLGQVTDDLAAGAVVVLGDDWLRIRRLFARLTTVTWLRVIVPHPRTALRPS